MRRSILLETPRPTCSPTAWGNGPPGRLPPPWPPAPRWRNSLGSKGTCFLAKDPAACRFPAVTVASFEEVSRSKRAYAQANLVEYDEHDPIRGKAVIQPHGNRYLICNPPPCP